jgi:hypothetical protein
VPSLCNPSYPMKNNGAINPFSASISAHECRSPTPITALLMPYPPSSQSIISSTLNLLLGLYFANAEGLSES